MKTCVTTYSFNAYIKKTGCDHFAVIDKAKEMGFDCIEFIDLDNDMWGDKAPVDTVAYASKIKDYCAEKGIEIAAYTVGGDLLAEDIEAEIARLKKCVDVAVALGAPVMRHDVTFKLPDEPLFNYERAIEAIAPRVREISLYAKEKGVKTCVENHGQIIQAPERVEALIQAVDCDNYGWMIDMGNFMCADCDPVKSVGIAARYAVHVHAKDFLFKSGELLKPEGFFGTAGGNYLRGTALGHGVVPVVTCVKRLAECGYDGPVSIEFEGYEEPLWAIEAGYKYLKEIFKQL